MQKKVPIDEALKSGLLQSCLILNTFCENAGADPKICDGIREVEVFLNQFFSQQNDTFIEEASTTMEIKINSGKPNSVNESTKKKIDLDKQKRDENSNENFIDEIDIKSGESNEEKIDFGKRKRDDNESVELTKKKERVGLLTNQQSIMNNTFIEEVLTKEIKINFGKQRSDKNSNEKIMDESNEKKIDLGKQKSNEISNEIDDIKLKWLNRLNRFDFYKRKMDEDSNDNKSVESTRKKKRVSVLTLDKICARFPKLRTEIAKKLDDESIINYKTGLPTCLPSVRAVTVPSLSCLSLNQVLEEDRSFWMQKVERLYHINCITEKHLFYDSWMKVIRKTPVEILKEIVNCLEGWFLFFTQVSRPDLCPLHVAAFFGNLKLVNHFIIKTKDYCPKNKHGWTPLHFVVLRGQLRSERKAQGYQFLSKEGPIQHIIEKIGFKKMLLDFDDYLGEYFRGCREYSENKTKNCLKMRATLKTGHLEICKMILGKIDTKNPADKEGWTPFHLAAFKGHLDICQTIIEQIDYNNMPNNHKTPVQWSPLEWAVHKGHVDVCRLILSKTNNFNPTFDHGNTLLHFAVSVGKLKVCKLLLENITNKNPTNDNQLTPLHQAVLKTRSNWYSTYYDLEICKFLWSNVEDKNAVLNIVNLSSGKTLKEDLAGGDESCQKVFKLFKI